MTGNLLPHTELLESIKDETGYENIRNLEDKIKRWAVDAEKKIGYNTALVLKKVTYEKDSLNFNGSDLWLPKDCWEMTGIFDGDVEVNPKNYHHTGEYIYFRKNKEPEAPTVFYEALTLNGHGWPVMSRNHKDAIVAYVVWKLATPKAFMSFNRSDRALVRDFEQDWRDERDAARGTDVTPGNTWEMKQLMDIWNSSRIDLVVNESCLVHESEYALAAQKSCVLREIPQSVRFFHWQFDEPNSTIAIGPSVDLTYLENNATEHKFEDMLLGKTLVNPNIFGRVAMAVQDIEENEYQVFDVLGQRIDDNVFEKYYNQSLKLLVLVSKEPYGTSNIFTQLRKS